MEIYKDLSNPKTKEFEKLLNTQLSKITIEEGKIIEGKINKITEKLFNTVFIGNKRFWWLGTSKKLEFDRLSLEFINIPKNSITQVLPK